MASQKKAHLIWQGGDRDFRVTLGSGYSFDMAPGLPTGGSPMEFLLAAAAGCTAMDVISILQKKRMNVTALELEISGVQAPTPPNVYTEATITYVVRGDVEPEAVERAIELSQTKYCSASIMLKRAGMTLHTEYRIEPALVAAAG